MNYSKDSRKKKSETPKNTAKKQQKKAKIAFFRILIIAVIIGGFAAFGAGLGWLIGILKSAPDVSQIDLKPKDNYTSFVYDQDGIEMDRISGNEDRIYVTLDNIPKYLQDAIIATEDERFYDHNGIDIRGIMRAAVTNLRSGDLSEGASTLTQQLIKNNILTTDKKFTRKIQEQYLALQVENLYDKDLILEYYLNTIPLGHGLNGVQAAANRYFNKDVSDLSLAESVVLAGITQAPTRYSPILNPENNLEKAKGILAKMVDQGSITQSQRETALAEDPYANVQKVHQKFIEESSHSYFVDAVVDSVLADLQSQKGWTSTQANQALYGGGIQIYTTFDPEIQAIVDEAMNDDSLFPSQSYELKINYSVTVKMADGSTRNLGGEGIVKNEDQIEAFKEAKLAEWGITSADKVEKEYVYQIPQPQAAFVISDHTTGHVKALSGGRGDKEGDRTFNRATQAKRQPGSLFKVLAAFAPALDTGALSPGSVIVDEPLDLNGYKPNNWYSGYRGPSTVRQGVYDSMNILAVKTVNMIGVNTSYDYLLNFGFTTLSASDKVDSLPLGGLTDGVTPLELNAAFGALANNGTYVKPILYTKVLDRDGNVLLENIPSSHQVVKESVAYMLTNMMEDVITKGTGGRLRSTFKVNMPISGKTGTTNDDRDLLFSGYTPYYTATVWLGHDQPKRLQYSYSNHLDLWGTIMNKVHEGLERKEFVQNTSGYELVTVCGTSGKLATDLCKLDPDSKLVTDYFLKGSVTEYCDWHVEVEICTVSGKLAGEFCPIDTIEKRVIVRTPTYDADGNLIPYIIDPSDFCDVHTESGFIEGEDSNQWWPWPWLDGENTDDSSQGEDDWFVTPPSNNNSNNGNNNNNNNNSGNTPPPETPPSAPPQTPTEDPGFFIP
jgi:penicillin-binding protein 1A